MRDSPPNGFSAFVIPAHAGIQVCSASPIAWIPAFAGMTEGCGGLFRFFIDRSSTQRFSKECTKATKDFTCELLKFVLFAPFVVKYVFFGCGSAPRWAECGLDVIAMDIERSILK